MAGHMAAMRALKAGSFDPFGENDDGSDSEGSDGAVEPAGGQ